MTSSPESLSASFRDPSGFVYKRDNEILRQINKQYESDYRQLMESGLYAELTAQKLLIEHEEIDISKRMTDDAFKIIRPKQLDFISYPYEWSFSQFKEAALLTLEIQKISVQYGMCLKDCSGFNIQFHQGKAVFIDTLSFEIHDKNKPWQAYCQFCQHFLAPLALMSYTDIRLQDLLVTNIDGIPLDLAKRLLPFRAKLNFGLLIHVILHANSQGRYVDKKVDTKKIVSSHYNILAFIDSLENTVRKLQWKAAGTEWGDYYTFTNYSEEAFEGKKEIVEEFLTRVSPDSVWDFGANNGLFSRLAAKRGIFTISSDIDPAAVEKNYLQMKHDHETTILPLLIDLINPTPSIGWGNRERDAITERKPIDISMALALIHHLAISNNLPFTHIAKLFASMGKYLIIEFVPKDDSKVQILLTTRKDIFPRYDKENFEKDFSLYFDILDSKSVKNSKRIVYLMQRK